MAAITFFTVANQAQGLPVWFRVALIVLYSAALIPMGWYLVKLIWGIWRKK